MIVVDASVWIGIAVADDVFYERSRAWLRAVRAGGEQLAGPTIVLAEVAGAVGRRTGRLDAATATFRAFEEHDAVRLVAVDDVLAREAARMAVDLGLRGADAVYVATAVRLGCPLVTWDDEMLRRAGSVVETQQPA